MASTTTRRIKALEAARERRDVPSVVMMVQPLSQEDQVRAVELRRRGCVVLEISEADARL